MADTIWYTSGETKSTKNLTQSTKRWRYKVNKYTWNMLFWRSKMKRQKMVMSSFRLLKLTRSEMTIYWSTYELILNVELKAEFFCVTYHKNKG